MSATIVREAAQNPLYHELFPGGKRAAQAIVSICSANSYVLRAALAITERPRTYICEADAWGSLPYDLLSLAYAHLGDAENAADACRNAVERSPQEERLRKNLALFEQMRER